MSKDYGIDEDGNENRILFWLRLDTWHLCDSAMLFADINPDSVQWESNIFIGLKALNNKDYLCDLSNPIPFWDSELKIFQGKYDDLHRILFNPDIEHDTPHNWIERALAKKISIPWLGFAIEQGFYEKPKQLLEVEKPISDKERETLLVIFAALAKEARIDILKTSKAGEIIASMTQQLGASIGATTIETHLKKIPQALENRAN